MNKYLILPTLKSYLLKNKALDQNHYVLTSPLELSKAIHYQNITIQYHPKNENQKETLIEIIDFLNQKGKNVTVTEFERIFDDDLLLELAKRNFDFQICLRYMLEGFYSSNNWEMTYSLQSYQEVIKKIKYVVERIKQTCFTEEEQVVLALIQLATYIKGPTKEELMQDPMSATLSDFYASIGRGKAVCMGYSMALWKVLIELHIPCHIIAGGTHSSEDITHAWNQVCINGVWYNVDLTWYSGSKDIKYLLQDDQSFLNHFPLTDDNKVESCSQSYPNEKINFFLEKFKNYPNFFVEYEEKQNERKPK